jgi:hypothetical protein
MVLLDGSKEASFPYQVVEIYALSGASFIREGHLVCCWDCLDLGWFWFLVQILPCRIFMSLTVDVSGYVPPPVPTIWTGLVQFWF